MSSRTAVASPLPSAHVLLVDNAALLCIFLLYASVEGGTKEFPLEILFLYDGGLIAIRSSFGSFIYIYTRI